MPVAQHCPACKAVVVADTTTAHKPVSCPLCGEPLGRASGIVQAQAPARIIAGHRLGRRIGVGAVSHVYLAEPCAGGPPCAIKILTLEAAKDPENCRRFAREAQILRGISHPNIVGVSEHGCEEGDHYMIMELIDGPDMDRSLAKGPLPWRTVAQLLLQVAQALAYLGRRGIVHRDIKPANIVLTGSGIAKLIDLGFAKRADENETENRSPSSTGISQEGMTMGSPAYMPPEQVVDARHATVTADIYSLGATCFHAVTGRLPFTGGAYEIMEQVLHDPAPTMIAVTPETPVALSQLVEWMMAKDPASRPQSAEQTLHELEIVLFAPDDGKRIPRLRRSRARARMVLVGLILGVVVAVLVFAAFLVLRH